MSPEPPLMLHVDGRCTGLRMRRAPGFWSRAAGLLFEPTATAQVALELRPCRAVHTLAMRRPIDLAFVAGDGRVLRTVRGLEPWRCAWQARAVATWELPAGGCDDHGVEVGVRLHARPAREPSPMLAASHRLEPRG